MSERRDLELIAELVPEGSRVLDLGCGNGELLDHLRRHRGCRGFGVEIADANIVECVKRDVKVLQLNLEEGLALFEDQSFDVVLQLDTLQHLRNTEKMLRETARVGRIGIVSFPNFAHWQVRLRLVFGGRMPETPSLPFKWYDTPNIHLCSIDDFRALCADMGVRIERAIVLDRNSKPINLPPLLANLLGEQAVFMLRRD